MANPVTDLSRKIQKCKESLDRLEKKKVALEATRKSVLQSLVQQFGVRTIDEARKRISTLEEELCDGEQQLSEIQDTLDEIMKIADKDVSCHGY